MTDMIEESSSIWFLFDIINITQEWIYIKS
jgi:hypothetical protein